MLKYLIVTAFLLFALNITSNAVLSTEAVGDSAAAQARVAAGEAAAKRGQWEEARRELELAVQIDPGNSVAFYDLGIAYLHMSLVNKAVETERRAIELNSKFVSAYIELGLALAQMNDLHGAEGAELMALDIDPQNKAAQRNLNVIQAKLKEVGTGTELSNCYQP